MRRAVQVRGLLVGVLLLGGMLPVAAQPLWLEKTSAEAARDQVQVPSAAPLVKMASQAVVNISINGKAPKDLPPEMDEEDLEEFFRRFHGGDIPKHLLRGLGTGFIIHPSGYILTNAHVVEESESIEVRLQNDEVGRKATVVGADPATDLALIKIDGQNLPVLPLGNSDSLEVGDFVIAIGNPFGLAHSASFGMVSAKGRRDINPSGRSGLYDFIQTDAAINPGNSGGPLINLRGEVVGINAAINAVGQGIGFAIPVNMAKALLPELKEKGHVTRSWLGVSIQKVTPELAQSFGLKNPGGALISHVVNDGPGAVAGLEPGDVIVEFDGKAVGRSVDLPLMAATAGVGRTVALKFIRDGKERQGKVTLVARPDDTHLANLKVEPDKAEALGVKVAPVDDAIRQKMGLPRGFEGVLVRAVDPTSEASMRGLREGDIIVKLNGRSITDVAGFLSQAKALKKGQIAKLFVRRGDSGVFVAFKS